jgi:hypothetical protein
MKELVLQLGYGHGNDEIKEITSLSRQSYNIYPDGEYLTNYSGRIDFFERVDGTKDVPPTYSGEYTSLISFIDVYGKKRLVFIYNDQVCWRDGNKFHVLYTFIGQNKDGKYFPFMFAHQGKLIICNFGDPVMVWDGLYFSKLGVTETPNAPEAKSTIAPMSNLYGGVIGAITIWRHRNYYWPGRLPISGSVENKDAAGVNDIHGYYKCVIQFVDRYGNRGRLSPASVMVFCDTWNRGANPTFIVLDWVPPMIDNHIVAINVGRTLNLNTGGGTGFETVFQLEKTVSGSTQCRETLVDRDATLAAKQVMVDGFAPQTCSFGCSWKGRIFLGGGENPCRIEWSDKTRFGEMVGFYLAKDNVVAIVPAGDRILVITRSVEVLYELQDSSIATLEVDFNNGSMHGKSFVDLGNGAVAGLFKSGFKIFDGQKYIDLESPYYIEGEYIDFNIHKAVYWKGYYILACRMRYENASYKTNTLLMCNLRSQQWYSIREDAYDICVFDDSLLCTDQSIFECFKGAYPSQAFLHIKNIKPKEYQLVSTRNIVGARLLIEPSSNIQFTLTIRGKLAAQSTVVAIPLPSEHSAGRFEEYDPYWNKPGVRYDINNNWSSPADLLLQPEQDRAVAGNVHDVGLTIPALHRFRIKAIVLQCSLPEELKP